MDEEFISESNAIERVYDENSFQQAMYAWHLMSAKKIITPSLICEIHKILMLNQSILEGEKGYWRNVAVYIGDRQGINALKIPEAIEHWCMNVMDAIKNGKNESEVWKERIVKQHHVEYERIHPFIDGNGRTGRIFMNWERLQLGLPILVIHEGHEQMEYYKWFKE